MTATVQLTDEEIKDLCDLTRVDNAEGAVRSALDEYRRYARRMRLKEISGQLAMGENGRNIEAESSEGESSFCAQEVGGRLVLVAPRVIRQAEVDAILE
ncbi:MAG: hypothetical protein ABSE62_14090 [Chthoniobacteraceae bacterium]